MQQLLGKLHDDCLVGANRSIGDSLGSFTLISASNNSMIEANLSMARTDGSALGKSQFMAVTFFLMLNAASFSASTPAMAGDVGTMVFSQTAKTSWFHGLCGLLFRFDTDGFWLNLHHFLYVLGRLGGGGRTSVVGIFSSDLGRSDG